MNLKKRIAMSWCWLLLALFTAGAMAQGNFVRIESVWKPGEQINIETGVPASSSTGPGWQSADWLLEPAGTGQVRIKNRWKGTYLHVELGELAAGPVQPGWHSAMWVTETVGDGVVRFRNLWKGTYLNIEKGVLEASPAPAGWLSSQWRIKGGATAAVAAVAGGAGSAGVGANSAAGQAILASAGRQCVNAPFGIGYAAKVRWYNPEQVMYDTANKGLSLAQGANASREESIAVGQSSCFDSQKKMFAQVSVVGGEIANQAITIAAGTALAVTAGVVCVGTAGTGCPAVVGVAGALAAGAVSTGSLFLPDAKTTFYLGSPGTLEIGGTVWQPTAKETRQFGQGKPAAAACSSDNECGNNTCAYGTSAAGAASVCCPSGAKTLYAGYNYCTKMPNGATCWSAAMCASGNCSGNMSGLQRGVCK